MARAQIQKIVQEDAEIEDDSETHYKELHNGHELAEICSKFSKTGEVMPGCIKGGLKIRIQLPNMSHPLPTLLDYFESYVYCVQ